jgi:hypothetical protein
LWRYHFEHKDFISNQRVRLDKTQTIFIDYIRDFLIEHDYKVDTCLGFENIYVELAVRHPNRENEYILGIISDNEYSLFYKNIKERERLPFEVLEQMGWKMYRVSVKEWFEDVKGAKKRLIDTLLMNAK